ncbi:MAG: hypothetical protein HRT58_18745 [Crocinitomicaceae bacterium]|nr:hypothetical protein [Flavobacteriales bacterium]NQZ37709.1 hypothetical protein [Crocinitomicaceae bacterium]
MKIRRIAIKSNNIQELGEIAVQYMGKDYVSVTNEMIVIGTESFRLRTSSAQWNMVVLKKQKSKIQIDIIGAAGGIGIFNFSLWSESGFTKKLFQEYLNYCETKGWNFEEIA